MLLCAAASVLTALSLVPSSATYDLGVLQVEVGEPFAVMKPDTGPCWAPWLSQISEKKLLVAMSVSADEINPEGARMAYLVTEDGGTTWSEPMYRTDSRATWIALPDGTFIWTQYTLDYVDDHTGAFQLGRSEDGVHYELSPATVDFSPHKITKGAHDTVSMVFCRSILEALDGSLLANMYWRFEGDTLDRSILVRSTDNGTTWRYYSTIGYDPAVGGEGLNEPCMVRLANGSILCLMRNGSGRPMYRSRSTDDGKTWSKPKRMPEKCASMSVYPDLCLMKSSVLVCSAGRPKGQLAFCLDPYGTSWTDPITIFDGASSCYTGIREVAPDTLLYVHDIGHAQVLGMFITVKRR